MWVKQCPSVLTSVTAGPPLALSHSDKRVLAPWWLLTRMSHWNTSGLTWHHWTSELTQSSSGTCRQIVQNDTFSSCWINTKHSALALHSGNHLCSLWISAHSLYGTGLMVEKGQFWSTVWWASVIQTPHLYCVFIYPSFPPFQPSIILSIKHLWCCFPLIY